MALVTLARHAMATRFEIVLHGARAAALRAAGEEALDEVERLEGRLSLFRPSSEIAHVNARAAREPVRVSPEVFNLLVLARCIHDETGGAFDITIAPLMRAWGFLGGAGRRPDRRAVEEARQTVGMRLVHLDPANYTVRFERPGVMLDLGAIGKGHAIDKAAEVLRETGVTSALIHGGTSTACGLGRPHDGPAWRVAVPRAAPAPASLPAGSNLRPQDVLPAVTLVDEALSVSAVWGKCFQAEGRVIGHVIDPRSGQPANRAVLAAVGLPCAAETDAFSTALLVAGPAGQDRIARARPGMKTLLLVERGGILRQESRGFDLPA
jgi:thiamine biosynthesis lipoprotein